MAPWIQLGAGWKYAPAYGGVDLHNPAGQSCYFQPGDEAAGFYAALESVDAAESNLGRPAALSMAFGEYFDS